MRSIQFVQSAGVTALLLTLPVGCGFSNPKGGPIPDSTQSAEDRASPPSATSTNGTPNDVPSGAPTGTPTATPGASPSVATFHQIFSEIIQPKCLSCHGSGRSPNLSTWSSFAQDTRYIISGNPTQSALYIAVQTKVMPKVGSPLNQAELQLVYNWIETGAQNN